MAEAEYITGEALVRAVWNLSQGGRYTVKNYRVAEVMGRALLEDEVGSALAAGLVRQISGMGGPSSFAMTITAEDLVMFAEGETYFAEVEMLAAMLASNDEP